MHERISVNTVCFLGSPLSTIGEYWRDLGAQRVSFVSHNIFTEGVEPAKLALKTGDYGVETTAHPFMPGKPLSCREHWPSAQATLNQLIEAVTQINGRSIYMLTGGHGSLSWELSAECFSEAIAPCVARAKDAGVTLLIENASTLYAESHIAHSLRDTVTLAEMAGIGVCVDFFGCWTEAGLEATIKRAVPRLGLVQLSDYVYGDRSLPSRAVPGDGAMPIKLHLEWLLRAGYTGAFDLELLGPRIDSEGSFNAVRRTGEYLDEILKSLGA